PAMRSPRKHRKGGTIMQLRVQLRSGIRPVLSMVTFGCIAIAATSASAQSTAFTYQGQLKNGGAPANGSYDMTFRLFDADAAGNQVGADVPISGVPVTNGLFTTTVDFGSAFSGSPLWLEIQVTDQVLSP